jgi:hypothetical protein
MIKEAAIPVVDESSFTKGQVVTIGDNKSFYLVTKVKDGCIFVKPRKRD